MKSVKNSSLKQIVLAMLLANCFSAMAQQDFRNPYVRNLEAKVFDGKVFLSWYTRAGFTCQDIDILIADDTLNFKKAGRYPGICGDTTEQRYEFVIDSPYYNIPTYIKLDMGTYGTSYYTKVIVYKKTPNVLIYPHPVSINSKLILPESLLSSEISIRFFDLNGKEIQLKSFRQREINIGQLDFQSGIWIYEISGVTNQKISNKIVVE